MLVNPLLNTHKVFKISAISVALALTACGGGGDGNTVDVVKPVPNGNSNNGNSNDLGNPNDNVINGLSISEIELYDAYDNLTRSVSSQGAVAKVTVRDDDGNGISSALVTFDGEGVVFGTSNGTVLTDANGNASISVKPESPNDTGSYQLNASANANGITVQATPYNFAIQPANIVISDFKAQKNDLNSGEATNLTLVTIDEVNNNVQNNTTVDFTATCGTFSQDSISSTNQGNITTTYNSVGSDGVLCEGNQTITATPINNTSAAKTLNISIQPVLANSLIYTSAKEVNLGSSTSGNSFSDAIEFTVYANGVPVANKEVEISKVQAPDDFSFIEKGNKQSKIVESNSEGKVLFQVYPGALPGPVELKATLVSKPEVFALSKDVSVSTGRPTQEGMSLSLEKNVLAYGVDGDTTDVNIRLVDRVGNPVPDNTVVSFISEGGSIDPNCSTSNGACTVEFRTQNPRPLDRRISILAYTEGEKSFIDIDGNNMFTPDSDKFSLNIGSFFRDDNENNQYDADKGEFIYRRGESKEACAPSTFQHPNIDGTCNNDLEAVLRSQTVLGLADGAPTYTDISTNSGRLMFKLYGNSEQTVSMPSATNVNVAAIDNTDNELSCSPKIVQGYLTIPDVVDIQSGTGKVAESEVSYSVSLKDCAPGDIVEVTVSTPSPLNNKTTTQFDL